MLRTRVLIVAVLTAICSAQTAQASVTFRNLTSGTIYYSWGYLENGLWHAEGWRTIKSGTAVKLPANRYYRFEDESGTVHFNSAGSAAKFWYRSDDDFWTSEAQRNVNEVYADGVRITIPSLIDDGYEFFTFRKYKDGTTWSWGKYWKVGTKPGLSFSHSSSGGKSPMTFSYLNNRIIDYKVNLTSSRGVKVGPVWSVSADQRKLSSSPFVLEGGPAWNPWRPSYKGTVTLVYVYR